MLIAKTKTCEGCGKEFMPRNSFQKVCFDRHCALKKVRRDKKREADELRERKEAIKTIPQLIQSAQVAFNAWVRARDEGLPCICCGRFSAGDYGHRGHAWDCGHYRSTGSASHLRFHPDNAHRQLVFCNRHGAGRAVDYRVGLIARIGLERVEALESNNTAHKWTREELIEITATYRRKLRDLKRS